MLPVYAQRICQTPRIELIGHRPARCLTIPISLRRLGLHRIDTQARIQHLLDHQAMAGFHRNG